MGRMFLPAFLVPVVLVLSLGQYNRDVLSFTVRANNSSDIGYAANVPHPRAVPDGSAEFASLIPISSADTIPSDLSTIEDFSPRDLLDSLSSYHKDSLLEVWDLYLTLIDSMRARTSPYKQRDVDVSSSGESRDLKASANAEKSGQDPPANASAGESGRSRSSAKDRERKRMAQSKLNRDFPASATVFYVQVAASRSPLEPEELRERYSGPEEPRILKKKGWYKYQIGETDNYIEAYLTLRSVKTSDAFIVVYDEDGNKQKLWKAILKQRRRIPDFRVQLAASRVRLGDERLNDIYSGSSDVREIEEDEWYKYQIDAGTTLKEARKKVRQSGVEDAFPVVYLNDRKMELSEIVEIFRLY